MANSKKGEVQNRGTASVTEAEKQPLVSETQVDDSTGKAKSNYQTGAQSTSTGSPIPEHIYIAPKASGLTYSEFPMLSMVLHFALFALMMIMYFTGTREAALLWVMGFFYVGIQIEGMIGEIPIVFQKGPGHSDISGFLRGWKQNWLNLSTDITSYHYIQKNVYGQKRRGKSYTYQKTVNFEYQTCEDVTRDISEYLKKDEIIFLKREISYSFGNEKAEQAFSSKLKPEVEAAQKADKFTEQETFFSFKDLEADPAQLIYVRASSIFVNRFFFWIASIFLFTIPYRFYVNAMTASLTYKIHKKIYV